MTGKVLTLALLISAAVAGILMYYLQVYAFYVEVEDDGAAVELVLLGTETSEAIPYAAFEAIDADSSPIRYRACFTTQISLATLTETYEAAPEAEPRLAPGWFDCFDAETLGPDLEAGAAIAFLGAKNVHYGVDRIVAIYPDGRGYAWHALNDCGEKAYDGTVVGEECPAREEEIN